MVPSLPLPHLICPTHSAIRGQGWMLLVDIGSCNLKYQVATSCNLICQAVRLLSIMLVHQWLSGRQWGLCKNRSMQGLIWNRGNKASPPPPKKFHNQTEVSTVIQYNNRSKHLNPKVIYVMQINLLNATRVTSTSTWCLFPAWGCLDIVPQGSGWKN